MHKILLLLSKQRPIWLASLMILMLPTIGHSVEWSDDKLRSFATAVLAINQIAEKWQPKVQAATSEDQAATLLEQVDTEMREVIESTEGLGIDEYQQILAAAQDDPALKGQIDGLLQEMTTN